MLVKLSVGIGRFGKLWTGTKLCPVHEDPKNMLWDVEADVAIPNIVDALIIERTCECGASTRKFRATAVQQSAEARSALDVPECFITAGDAGSIVVDERVSPAVRVHNWSGRTGGHVILQPLMVLSGYVSQDDLPGVKPGYGWACTYRGKTLSEYVLLPHAAPPSERGGPQAPHALLGWGLPTVKLSSRCPPCRKQREAAESAAQPQPQVALATDGKYTLTFDGHYYKAGCREFPTREGALAHWDRTDPRAQLFAEAIRSFVEPAIEQASEEAI